jgi:Mrp family chromosome partitioning ATPase
MSRNFALLQKLEQERRSRTGPSSRLVPASEASFPQLEVEPESQPVRQSPDEVCMLVRRLFLLDPGEQRIIVFSSVERKAGCSWMAAHCAQVLATQVRRSVCLVDANLHFPALHSLFGVENGNGFADVMLRAQPLVKCATQVAPRNLWLLTAGGRSAHDRFPDIESLRDCIGQLREQFDYTIIDAPPWSFNSHPALLGSSADGIVLVLKADSSRRSAVQNAVGEIKAANMCLLGAVLNRRAFPIPKAIYDRL